MVKPLKIREMIKIIYVHYLQSRFSVVGASQATVSERLTDAEAARVPDSGRHFVLVPVADVDKLSLNALRYAKTLGGEAVAVHILLDSLDRDKLECRWNILDIDTPLAIIESPDGSLIGPLRSYMDELRRSREESVITILLPVLVTLKWWHRLLHNQTAWRLKTALLAHPGIVVTDIPQHLTRRTENNLQP